jgi:hypothetical protein
MLVAPSFKKYPQEGQVWGTNKRYAASVRPTVELRQQPRLPSVKVLTDDAQAAAEPTVAENGGQGVDALPHLRRDVVGAVIDPFVVIRPTGDQKIVADLPPVQPRLDDALAGHVQHGAPERLAQREVLAEVRAGKVVVLAVVRDHRPGVVPADPLGLPRLRVEDSHRPLRRRDPGLRLTAAVPDPHLPQAPLVRAKRFPLIVDLRRAVRGDFAAVPQVSLIPRELLRRRGHQNLIRRLPLAPLVGLDRPAQAGPDHVDPQRVVAVFAAQPADGGAGKLRRQHETEKQDRDRRGRLLHHCTVPLADFQGVL